jgi:predicted metal-dependent phosphoesterase TrpH
MPADSTILQSINVKTRVDLHLHSSASFDCRVDPRRVAARCRRLGLSPVVLTDHDTIAGAAALQEETQTQVVVGEEIITTQGEIIGLFLERAVPPDLTPDEAVRRIKDQGGLVYLEHPYDQRRRCLQEAAIQRLAGQFDIVEVFNGRAPLAANERAEALCDILGTAAGAGSDAHTIPEIGSVYVELEAFDGAQDFLRKLRLGRVVHRRSPRLLSQLLGTGRRR